MRYSGKHRKSGIWSRIMRKQSEPGEPVKWNRFGQRYTKLGEWHETDERVRIMPRYLGEYILPDSCLN